MDERRLRRRVTSNRSTEATVGGRLRRLRKTERLPIVGKGYKAWRRPRTLPSYDYDDNDPHGNPVSLDFGFMTSVLWNEDAEKFQMWYMAWRHAGTGYAESTDGIHWTKPSIGVGVTDEEPGNIIKRAQSFSCAIDPTPCPRDTLKSSRLAWTATWTTCVPGGSGLFG